MNNRTIAMIGAAAMGAIALATSIGAQTVGAAPDKKPAVYWMSAQTGSGLTGDMRAAILGGGGGASHDLVLQLASGRTAQGAPSGEHIVPSALRAGQSLPLVAPPVARSSRGETSPPVRVPNSTSAKVVIYWGCGENPASGSPRTMDTRNPAAAFSGVSVRSMTEPSAANHVSYAEWPNPKSKVEIKGNSSLAGAHTIQSTFAPEIRFQLNPDQDFLAPIKLSQQKTGSGAMGMNWAGVDRSTGYFLSVMGAGRDGTAVIWTSSEVPLSTFIIDEFLDPAEVARLISLKAVLPSTARTCTIPAAVMKAIETPVLSMTAFGQEVNIGEPKPAGALANWRPSWLMKLRLRSSTRILLGAAAGLPGLSQGAESEREASSPEPKQKKKRGGLLRALGEGMIPGL